MTDIFRLIFARKVFVTFVIAISTLGSFVSIVFYNVAYMAYHGDFSYERFFAFEILSFASLGAVLIVMICLLFEAYILGVEESSLYRLLNQGTPSDRVDVFYFILFASNIGNVLGFIISLGGGYYLSNKIYEYFGFSFMRDAGFTEYLLVLIFFNTFVFYVHHRFFHSRWLWVLHKVHHSAESMNLVTSFRNHPLNYTIRNILFAFPLAILGVHPLAVVVYKIVNGIYQLMVHTEMDWNLPFVEKYILIGPAYHRIHHSMAIEHFNTNFGILILWDWLFGTLRRGTGRNLTYGVDDDLFNRDKSSFQEMVRITRYWILGLLGEKRMRDENA